MSELSNLTPYEAAKVTNYVLKSNGLDAEVKPQMMYNYARKNIIENVRDENDKIYFVGESFKTWLDKYVTKIQNGETTSRRNYEEFSQQYM